MFVILVPNLRLRGFVRVKRTLHGGAPRPDLPLDVEALHPAPVRNPRSVRLQGAAESKKARSRTAACARCLRGLALCGLDSSRHLIAKGGVPQDTWAPLENGTLVANEGSRMLARSASFMDVAWVARRKRLGDPGALSTWSLRPRAGRSTARRTITSTRERAPPPCERAAPGSRWCSLVPFGIRGDPASSSVR